ncbi:ABC transporter permease, partial [Burkholderia contaminans]|uniref:ABC transporter permease n=1 Tax=Burkholderia contaminans TaxID=488447 RepID=UPI0021BC1155
GARVGGGGPPPGGGGGGAPYPRRAARPAVGGAAPPRLVRGEFIGLAQREFVLAARLAGESPAALVRRQILPHVWPPLAVLAALMVATAILTESALSFLGLGDPSQMSWGFMIGAARNVVRDAWWLSIWPGLAIVATALAVNRVGEGLRHASALAEHGR